MSMQINKSAYEKLIKEDIEWLLSNTKDSLERRHIVEVLNYSPERLYASGSSEIPKNLEEAAIRAAQSDMQDRQIMEASNDERMRYSRIFRRGFKAGAKWDREQMMKEAVEKKGVVLDDEFVKFDDGTFLDFRDPTLSINPAFVLPKNGEKVKVIIVKEEGK